jgi:poly(A) polymerase
MSTGGAVLPGVLENPTVRVVADAFTAAGRDLYLVGGSVRDTVLGSPPSDLDFTTDARPDDIERILGPVTDALWTVGREFGTIAGSVAGHTVEVTTYRSEVYADASRKPHVTFGDSVVEDLRRRDFTVNAMALSLPDAELIDPFGGIRDLAAQRLATPRSATESFEEDPLRMLRAARFVGQLSLTPTADVRRAMSDMHHRLSIVSAERVRDEFSKLVVLSQVTEALWLLVDSGLFDEFAPEIPAMRVEQDPIHRHKDVLTHTIAVTQKSPPRLVVRLAALFHDIAKPATRSIGPHGVQFHHHDVVGAKMTRKRLRALKYPKEMVDDVAKLVFLHLRVHTYAMGWTDSAVRRYVRDAGPLLDDLNALVRSDCTTRNKRKADELARRMDELDARIEELAAEEELRALRPALDGRQVMEHLGLAPGPEIGAALDHLLEIRIEEGEIDEAEAYRRLDAWWETHAE